MADIEAADDTLAHLDRRHRRRPRQQQQRCRQRLAGADPERAPGPGGNFLAPPPRPNRGQDPAVSIRSSIKPDYHRLPGRREETEDAQAASDDALQHDPRRLSPQMGARRRLSDGRAQLCRTAADARQVDRARDQAGQAQSKISGPMHAGRSARCMPSLQSHAPNDRHRAALRRQGPQDHRAAQDHRARARRQRGPPRRRDASFARRGGRSRTSRSPPSIGPSGCSRRPGSSSGTSSATAARAMRRSARPTTTI